MIEPPPSLKLESVQQVPGDRRTPSTLVSSALTRETVKHALEEAGGNESAAARKLGVTRGKLRRFLEDPTD
jgi:ActR/RegA family two-component response regulator